MKIEMMFLTSIWSLILLGLFIADLKWGKVMFYNRRNKVLYVIVVYFWILIPWWLI